MTEVSLKHFKDSYRQIDNIIGDNKAYLSLEHCAAIIDAIPEDYIITKYLDIFKEVLKF
jgi:hypothetical protein